MPSAGQRAYDAIRQGLAAGEYVSGERLREEDLSSAFGVSRTPVREALRRLSAEGFVEFLANRGAHVASWSDDQLEEIFELRALLEGYAAKRAAVRMDTDQLAKLSDLASRMDGLVNGREPALETIAMLNNEFHQLMLVASQGPQLEFLTRAIVHIPLVQRTFNRYSRSDLKRSSTQHLELVEACQAGDGAWAEAVMRSHILSARHIFDAAADQNQSAEENHAETSKSVDDRSRRS